MSARTGIAGRGALVWWARPAVAVSFLYLVVIWAARPWKAGDTPFVLDGTDALTECLSAGTSSPAASRESSTSGAS